MRSFGLLLGAPAGTVVAAYLSLVLELDRYEASAGSMIGVGR